MAAPTSYYPPERYSSEQYLPPQPPPTTSGLDWRDREYGDYGTSRDYYIDDPRQRESYKRRPPSTNT